MSETKLNRVEMDIMQWQNYEIRFSKLFSLTFSDHRILLGEKLNFFDGIVLKYQTVTDHSERITMRLLKHEIRQMSRLLYPNTLWRFWKRQLSKLFSKPLPKRVVKTNVKLKQAVTTRSYSQSVNKALSKTTANVLDSGKRVPQNDVNNEGHKKDGPQAAAKLIRIEKNKVEDTNHVKSKIKQESSGNETKNKRTIRKRSIGR